MSLSHGALLPLLAALLLQYSGTSQAQPSRASDIIRSSVSAADSSDDGGAGEATGGRVRGITNRFAGRSGEGEEQEVGAPDFILGGLFPVHAESSGGDECGPFRVQGGLDRLEAMLFALDSINANQTILPNITLGYDIRDTCYLEHIGLDEAADLILTGHSLQTVVQIETCPNNETASDLESPISNASSLVLPTLGLIGATASRVSIPIAGLSRLFTVPQVSYASTSAILNSRERFEYFYRTIPADTFEARAIVDLIRHLNWTYISTVFSEDSYGQSGTNDLVEFAEKYDICIDLRKGIAEDFNMYDSLAKELVQSEAKVVVLYASPQIAQKLLEAVSRTPGNRRLTWIATSAWSQSTAILRQFNSTIAGMFGTTPLFRSVLEFINYYSDLTPENNLRNAWFEEFLDTLNATNCTPDSNSSACAVVDDRLYSMEYAIPLVIDAVYTFAHALHSFFEENCDLPITWDRDQRQCVGQKEELTGSILLNYIRNVTFLSPSGNTVRFDGHGSVEAIYEILNYQARLSTGGDNPSIEYNLVTIATWDGIVALNDNETSPIKMLSGILPQFGVDDSNNLIDQSAPSECGSCSAGKYLRVIPSSCCGLCEACLGTLFSNSSQADSCLNCSSFGEFWGNSPLDGSDSCVDIPTVFLRFSHPWSVITLIIALIGLLAVVFIVVVYAKFWDTPVVKSSSRENMVILLFGIVLSFVTTLFYLSPPSVPICVFQRTLLWLCFAMISSTLAMKTIRIARLFVFQKNSLTKLRFMETKHQVIFTVILIVIQMVIVFISLLAEHPLVRRDIRPNRDDTNALPQVIVTCEPDPVVILVISACYETGLLIIATVLGTLSFKYPANFNEARSICCAAFALLAIWAGFFPAYFITIDIQEYQNAVIAFAVVLSGLAVAVCLFGPRLYILLFWKERNTKHHSRRPTEDDLPDLTAFQTVVDTLDRSESEDGSSPPAVKSKKLSVTFANGHPVTEKHSPPPPSPPLTD